MAQTRAAPCPTRRPRALGGRSASAWGRVEPTLLFFALVRGLTEVLTSPNKLGLTACVGNALMADGAWQLLLAAMGAAPFAGAAADGSCPCPSHAGRTYCPLDKTPGQCDKASHPPCQPGGICLSLHGGTMLSPCDRAPWSSYGYCDHTLDIEKRLDDLMSRMTLQDKLDAMDGHSFPTVYGMCNERKGPSHDPPLFVNNISGAQHSECLHGVADGCAHNATSGTGCPTAFPNAGSLGASFNTSLWLKIGDAIGKERRALNNVAGRPSGMACWSPDINLARDPRWGRFQEVPSEDSLVTSYYAVNYARGMQYGASAEPHGYIQTVWLRPIWLWPM